MAAVVLIAADVLSECEEAHMSHDKTPNELNRVTAEKGAGKG